MKARRFLRGLRSEERAILAAALARKNSLAVLQPAPTFNNDIHQILRRTRGERFVSGS